MVSWKVKHVLFNVSLLPYNCPLSSFFSFVHSISQHLLSSNVISYAHSTRLIRYIIKLVAPVSNWGLSSQWIAICQIFHYLLLILMFLFQHRKLQYLSIFKTQHFRDIQNLFFHNEIWACWCCLLSPYLFHYYLFHPLGFIQSTDVQSDLHICASNTSNYQGALPDPFSSQVWNKCFRFMLRNHYAIVLRVLHHSSWSTTTNRVQELHRVVRTWK